MVIDVVCEFSKGKWKKGTYGQCYVLWLTAFPSYLVGIRYQKKKEMHFLQYKEIKQISGPESWENCGECISVWAPTAINKGLCEEEENSKEGSVLAFIEMWPRLACKETQTKRKLHLSCCFDIKHIRLLR